MTDSFLKKLYEAEKRDNIKKSLTKGGKNE